jgi:hypothetical protein
VSEDKVSSITDQIEEDKLSSDNTNLSTSVPVTSALLFDSFEHGKTRFLSKTANIKNGSEKTEIGSEIDPEPKHMPLLSCIPKQFDYTSTIAIPKITFPQRLSMCELTSASSTSAHNLVTCITSDVIKNGTQNSFTTLVCPPPMLGSKNVKQKFKRPTNYTNGDSFSNNIKSPENCYPSYGQVNEMDLVNNCDGKTSRLLMKTDCKGGRGGRKRNGDGNTSLVHSIPKFSEVAPKSGGISEVQKVLQSRLLSKRKERQQEKMQDNNNKNTLDKINHKNPNTLSEASMAVNVSEAYSISRLQKNMDVTNQSNDEVSCIDLKATNILQNMITLHEQKTESTKTSTMNIIQQPQRNNIFEGNSKCLQVRTPASLLSMQKNVFSGATTKTMVVNDQNFKTPGFDNFRGTPLVSSNATLNSNNRRKSRKPNKLEICHVVQDNIAKCKQEGEITSPITLNASTEPNGGDTSSTSHLKRYSFIEEKTVHLSPEVTITPTKMVIQRDDISTNTLTSQNEILNLSKAKNNLNSPTYQHSYNENLSELLPKSPITEVQHEICKDINKDLTKPNQPILSPEQYEASGLPSGYIYWPTANVFVHPSTIPEHFLCDSSMQDKHNKGIHEIIPRDNDEENNANKHPKYRKILPKEGQSYTIHGTESKSRSQSKSTISSFNACPHDNIFQFTR